MSAGPTAREIRRTEGADSVQALQRVLYRSAKQQPQRQFHALYDKVSRRDILERAWEQVRVNNGAPGVDGVSIDDMESAGVSEFLDGIAATLESNKYRPKPLRRVEIPKPGQPGKFRPLSIPITRDRVVMTAAKLVLEPIFEADFKPSSFGFRPKRSAHDALETVRQAANANGNWILDADIENCFSEIDHDELMKQIERRVSDQKMLRLIRSWLKVGILQDGEKSDQESGTPQGSPISPLLANIALNVLDEQWDDGKDGTLVKFADDLVVVCKSRTQAEKAKGKVTTTIAGVGLRLHPGKTRIVNLTNGQEGLDFLGFHLHKRESRKWRNRWYLHSWPSRKAMQVIRGRIRHITARRYVGSSVNEIVERVNDAMLAWSRYYRYGMPSDCFASIRSYAHECLAIFTSNKHGLRGRNWTTRYNYTWSQRIGCGSCEERLGSSLTREFRESINA